MSNSGDGTTPINHIVHCPIHTSIQIKRRKRNGEWLQLMKECPLCLADDYDGAWSNSCPSSSSNRRASPRQQHRKHIPHTPSRFKESKNDEPSPSSSPITLSPKAINDDFVDDEMNMEGSDQTLSEPYGLVSPRLKELCERVSSTKFPTLPFSPEEDELAKKAAEMAKLLQHRKEKIRELKIRTLVPPSQRYQNFNVGTRSGKAHVSFTHSEATQRVGNKTSDVGGQFSFHSEAAHYMGQVTKEQLVATKKMGNLKSNRAGKKHAARHVESSTLEISYDSFICSNGLGRVDSGDVTLAHDNTTSRRRHNINAVKHAKPRTSNMEYIAESEMDSMLSSESNDDLHKATRDIWGNIDSSHDHSQGGNNEGNLRPRQDATLRHHKDDSFVNGNPVRRTHATSKIEMHPQNDVFEDMNRQLHSLSISKKHDKARESSKYRGKEEVIVEDFTDEESSSGDVQDVYRFSAGRSTRGKEPPGHKSDTSSEQSNYYSNPDAPDIPCSDAEDSNSSCSSCVTLVAKEGLDDHHMAFNKVGVSSLQGREMGKPRVHAGRQETDCPSDPSARSVASRSSSSTESISPQWFERKERSVRNNGEKESPSPSNPSTIQSSSRTESSSGTSHSSSRKRSSTSVDESSKSNTKREFPSDPSARSLASRSSSSTKSISPQWFERKERSIRNNGKKETPTPSNPSTIQSSSRTESSSGTSHSSSRKRSSTSVDGSSKSNTQSGSSSQMNPMQGNGYSRQDSDNSADNKKTFSNCDSNGRCVRHSHVQLRKRRRIGGWKKGRWKTIMMNCTECCFEEVQRLRERNMRTKEQLLSSQATFPPPSGSYIKNNGNDTSETESLSATSNSSNDGFADSRHQLPRGLLKKPTCRGDESSFSSNSTGSELTTTFSYMSSLSANSSSAGFSSTCSSSTARSSLAGFSKRPMGILRGASFSSSKISSVSSARTSGNSVRSNVSRVVFAGRDHVITL